MAQIDYNRPNTRARIDARRRNKRQRSTPRVSGLMQRMASYWPRRDAQRQSVRPKPRPNADKGSLVTPGIRRTAVGWIVSGRLFSLLLAAACCAALYHLFDSPQFVLSRVTLTGGVMLNEEHVARLADVAGQSVWYVDTAAAAERVRADPFVEQVGMQVVLPGQLHVWIQERQPALRWRLGSVEYLVDERGTVLATASDADPKALVLVENSGARELHPGDVIDPDSLKLARQLVLRLPGELGLTPAQLGWDIALGVFVRSPAGQTIVFGRSDHLERKLAVLHYLQNDGTPYTYLDLRPETPFYRNEGASPAPTAEPTAPPEG